MIASPTNLNISPPLAPIMFIICSIYRLMQNVRHSAPTRPFLEKASESLVKPEISLKRPTESVM